MPVEIAPNQKGIRILKILSLVSFLLAIVAVSGVVLLSTRIARLSDELAQSRKASDKKIVDADAKAEAATAELARLGTRLYATEKQATQLSEAALQRSISPAQKARIVPLLAAFAGKSLEVQALGPSQETGVYAGQVAATLEAAGIKAHAAMVVGPSGVGLAVLVRDAKAPPSLAKGLQEAFGAAGINVEIQGVAAAPPDTCILVVGSKPGS
jgi:hypothetical protein